MKNDIASFCNKTPAVQTIIQIKQSWGKLQLFNMSNQQRLAQPTSLIHFVKLFTQKK